MWRSQSFSHECVFSGGSWQRRFRAALRYLSQSFTNFFFPVAMLIIHIRKVCNASSCVNV